MEGESWETRERGEDKVDKGSGAIGRERKCRDKIEWKSWVRSQKRKKSKNWKRYKVEKESELRK